MGSLFSSCKETEQASPQKTTQKKREPQKLSANDIAIIDLKKTRDTLYEKQKQIDAQIEANEKEIQTLILNKKRERAKFAFEKKKLYQKYLDNIDNKAMVIQKMIGEVQQAQMDKDISETMKQANAFLKDVQQTVNADQLQDNLMEMQENQQEQEQFQELFKQYGVNENQEELEDEYNQLEAQFLVQDTQNIPQPNIDTNLINQQQQQKQEQEQQIQQEQPQQQQQQQQQQQPELDDMLA